MHPHIPGLECVGLQLGPPTTDHNWGHQGWFRASNTNGRSRCGKPGEERPPSYSPTTTLVAPGWCPSAPSSRGLRHSLIQRSQSPLSEQISGVSRLLQTISIMQKAHLQYGWLRMVWWAFLIWDRYLWNVLSYVLAHHLESWFWLQE